MTAVDGMNSRVKEMVANFKSARAVLEQWKLETYPSGTVVYLECDRYTGYAIVENNTQCPSEQLSVVLENGNNWWYPVVQAFDASCWPGKWPEWIKRKRGI